MPWVAKNDITGKVYGKPHDSIYDCQKYIDTDLVILQYEWRRIAYLEEDLKYDEDYKEWFEERYKDNKATGINAISLSLFTRIEYAIHTLAEDKHREQNVIRCWNVEQKRYATGFDY